jgi:hypothetical protein
MNSDAKLPIFLHLFRPSWPPQFRTILFAVLAGVTAVACSSAPFTLDSTGSYSYPSAVNPAFEEIAVFVTITNRSGDDLQVNPTDFVARDTTRHVYLASPPATTSGVPLAGVPLKMASSLPLPIVTLRNDDVLTGYVVFDVPTNTQLAQLIWRQSDKDYNVNLASAR